MSEASCSIFLSRLWMKMSRIITSASAKSSTSKPIRIHICLRRMFSVSSCKAIVCSLSARSFWMANSAIWRVIS